MSSITVSSANSNKKTRKKQQQQTTNSQEAINKLSNITNKTTTGGGGVKTPQVDKKSNKNSLESLIDVDSRGPGVKKSNRMATFLTDAFLNASLRNGGSKTDLTTKSAENDTKQVRKQKANVSSNKKNAGKQVPPSATTSPSVKKSNSNNKIVVQQNEKAVGQNNSETDSLRKSMSDIRDRYWSYLFENLQRAIDEIYSTCENDNSLNECKEVIAVLENYVSKFRSVAHKIKLTSEFEKAAAMMATRTDSTSNKHPVSVAWEFIKSSPASKNYNELLVKKSWTNDNRQHKGGQSTTASIVSSKKESPSSLSSNSFTWSPANNKPQANTNTGFKDFLPGEVLLTSNKTGQLEFEDYLDDESSFGSNNPVDLLNHETFSDMQSTNDNIEDMSFNTLSITPPLQSKSEQKPFHELNNLPYQSLFSNSTSLSQQQHSLLMPSNHLLTNLNQQMSGMFLNTGGNKMLPNGFNPPPGSLNNSISTFLPMSGSSIPYLNESISSLNNNLLNSQGFGSTGLAGAGYSMMGGEEEDAYKFNWNNFLVHEMALLDDDLKHIMIQDDELEDEEVDEEFDEYDDDDEDELDEFLKSKDKIRQHHRRHKKIMKMYEEEEMNIALEIKQDQKLLSVLAEEVKLTKQLSAEKMAHYNHHFQTLKDNYLLDHHHTSKLSTDGDTNDERNLTPLQSEPVSTPDPASRGSNMHEKLMLLTRKVSPNERRRKHEEKQARAQEKREQFYQERLNKLKDLTRRIEEVNQIKKKLLKAKKASLKAKLERAEEKRQCLLRLKATKAAVEEQKAHEIMFINSLAAQNRKQDILEKHEKRQETIKQNLEEERLRKQEEQKAKEQAAELRRKTLESQRMAKLKEMLEKRALKQSKIEQSQLEKEKERIEQARAKEKTREQRLATMEAQFQANKQQVRRRIIQKQEEWSKRHELNLEEIRKKAFEMSILRFSSANDMLGDNESGSAHGGLPTPTLYERPKQCCACQVTINSDVQLKSHLRGLKHQQIMTDASQGKNLTQSEIEEYNLKCIVDMDKRPGSSDQEWALLEEKRKVMRKRIKKLKNKILSKGVEYETLKKKNDSSPKGALNSATLAKSKVTKLVREMEKYVNDKSSSSSILDKTCSELNRMLTTAQQSNQKLDQQVFRQLDGVSICVKLLETILSSTSSPSTSPPPNGDLNPITARTSNNLINLILTSCSTSQEICTDMVSSNKLLSLVEILSIYSSVMLNDNVLNESASSPISLTTTGGVKCSSEWLICSNLIRIISVIYASFNETDSISDNADLIQRGVDLISLLTSYGLIDTLSIFFSNIRGPLDEEQQTAEVLSNCLRFLISITKFLTQNKKFPDIFSERKLDDSTQLIVTFKSANLVNIIPMLYGMLHKDASSTPVKLGNNSTASLNVKKQAGITIELATLSVKLLNQMIVLDLNVIQGLLGEDSSSLQLRHIASYLIWYLTTHKHDDLLHEIILLIGYYTVLNQENQMKIELGTSPTIIQQLCNLPFNYFSDKKLISILFPTLICCCFNNEKNKSVLTSELSSDMLASFISDKMNEKSTDDKFELTKRFPSKLWSQALNYFSSAVIAQN